MSKTPNYDQKVKAILDTLQPGERVCTLTGEKWMMDEEEIGWYKTFNVPPHPWTPIVRLKHLMGFPSGIAIWKKPHAETGEPVLSFVHPDSPFQVITDKEWYSREFAQTGKELDPQTPFFDQFRSLVRTTPVGALRDDGSNVNCVGVDIITSRDSYMLFSGHGNNHDLYAAISYESEDSCLLTNVKSAKRSYMLNACAEVYNCRYCFQTGKLLNCTFCFDCDNLEFCFGATNQSHKKYLFWNEQLTKEEWERRVAEIDLSDQRVWDAQVERFHQMVREEAFWRPNFNIEPLEDCTGEYLMSSTRVRDSYWHGDCTNLYRCWIGLKIRDSAYSVWSGWGDRSYLSSDLIKGHEIKMCMRVWNSQNMEYCIDCHDCEDCFGCVGLRKKRFHIFNHPYEEAEYWQRIDAIKCAMLERGEYGLFFPADFSACGYEYSQGQAYLGYTDRELEYFGAPVFDPTKGNVSNGLSMLTSSQIPLHLNDLHPEQFVNKPILDETLGRPFMIPQSEYDFLKTHKLPPPRQHFLARMIHLFRHSNTPIEEQVSCAHCHQLVVTYQNTLFSGHRRVLCRPCYLSFMESR